MSLEKVLTLAPPLTIRTVVGSELTWFLLRFRTFGMMLGSASLEVCRSQKNWFSANLHLCPWWEQKNRIIFCSVGSIVFHCGEIDKIQDLRSMDHRLVKTSHSIVSNFYFAWIQPRFSVGRNLSVSSWKVGRPHCYGLNRCGWMWSWLFNVSVLIVVVASQRCKVVHSVQSRNAASHVWAFAWGTLPKGHIAQGITANVRTP